MALQALWAPETQFQNKNGSLLVFGKIYVQYRGRSQLAKTYRDADGTYLNTNPLLTDNDGRVLCFADDAFSYTAIVCDFYGNELFSFDPIPCGSGSGSGSSTGSSAQHWIGINGQTQQVSRNTYTRLKLPSGLDNVDYEGDFVLGTIKGSGTEMVLKEGLYLVNTVIRFKQSSDDLTNTLSNVIVHTRDFDTPNIQEVGAVIRDEAGPDASDDIHTITLTYIRHVSEDDAGSDRIKFAVETPNTWSECYIQNLQIAKLGSSVGGGGSASIYSAGDYISIENDTISVTGIEPENYATHDELQSATSAFITSADLPDLSEYATEQWVLDKHYITSADIPEIPDDLVTSAELAQTSGLIEQDIADLTSAISEALADKMDKSSSGDFYPRYDNPEGYLTSVPPEYVTDFEMSGYVQDHTSGFITSADLPDVSDMATKTWVTDQHYITSADVPPQIEYSAGDNIDITNHVVSVTDTSLLLAGENVSITPSGTDYIISAQVPETSAFVTGQEMNDAIQSATSAFITSADIPDIPDDVVTSAELATVSGEIVNQIPSLDGYATEEYVTEQTSAFLTSADLPDVSDMATKTWVGEQGYLTSIPSEYVTDTELESSISGKADTSAIPDVSKFVTQEDIDSSVSGKMDATESSAFYPMATNPSGYLTSADVDMSAYIPYSAAGVDLPNSNFKIDLEGQAYKKTNTPVALEKDSSSTTDSTVIKGGFEIVEGDIITVNGIDDGISPEVYFTVIPTVGDPATYIINVQSDDNGNHVSWTVNSAFDGKTINSINVRYSDFYPIGKNTSATIQYVNGLKYVTEDVLTNELSTKMNASQSSAFYPRYSNPNNYMTKSQADSYYIPYSAAGVDLPNSNFSIDVSGQAYKKISGTTPLTIDSSSSTGFAITNSESLSKIQPSSKLIISNISNSGGSYPLVSVTIIDTGYRPLFSLSNASVTNGTLEVDIPSDFNPYGMTIKRMDVEGSPSYYPMGTDVTVEVEGKVGSPYALESYVDSAVSGKQDTLTFGYDSSDKINAINGSAIAGGGSVPEGVMVESGLQYNAVGEISGYGESAIAQYGAEKQWLVHDDTIVHMSNSAQYAFGVNLSAVAQLLGVDETVLYSANPSTDDPKTSTFTVSEPMTSFEKIRFENVGYTYVNSENTVRAPSATNEEVTTCFTYYCKSTDGNPLQMSMGAYSSSDGLTYNLIRSKFVYVPNSNTSWNTNTTDGPRLCKIVGIGRKQSN